MRTYLADPDLTLWLGSALDVLPGLPDAAADVAITSPPYLNARPEYGTLSASEWRVFFAELRRVVRGPALFNVGRLWRDKKESDWWMRLLRLARRDWDHLDTVVWVKPNSNPIHGRFFANSHEYVLVLGDADRDELNIDAVRTEYDEESLARLNRRWRSGSGVKGGVREQAGRAAHPDGARPRSFVVCYVGKEKGNPHPAPMALDFAEYLVLAGSRVGQTVLDPFTGSGTTALACRLHGRRFLGIELDEDYCGLTEARTSQLSILTGC